MPHASSTVCLIESLPPHAFTVFGEKRYRKEADTKSWKRFTAFLAETLD